MTRAFPQPQKPKTVDPRTLDPENVVIDTSYDKESRVGCATTQGLRSHQEDRHLFGYLPASVAPIFSSFTTAHKRQVLESIVTELQTRFGNQNKRTNIYGATFLLCIITDNAEEIINVDTGEVITVNERVIITVNAGDSSAIKIDPELKSHVRLNTILHRPDPKDPRCAGEFEYVNPFVFPDKQGVWRMMDGGHAVSRGIESIQYKNFRSTPDIYFNKYKAGDILLLACDGLTEENPLTKSACLTEKEIAHLILNDPELVKDPSLLIKMALGHGRAPEDTRWRTHDNVSCLITQLGEAPITLDAPPLAMEEAPRFILLCDGHGFPGMGHVMAELIRDNFLNVFENQIFLLKDQIDRAAGILPQQLNFVKPPSIQAAQEWDEFALLQESGSTQQDGLPVKAVTTLEDLSGAQERPVSKSKLSRKNPEEDEAELPTKSSSIHAAPSKKRSLSEISGKRLPDSQSKSSRKNSEEDEASPTPPPIKRTQKFGGPEEEALPTTSSPLSPTFFQKIATIKKPLTRRCSTEMIIAGTESLPVSPPALVKS